MKDTTRFLHKAQKRSVRNGIRRYGLKQHAWQDESFMLIPFTGKVDKNSQKDRNALQAACVTALGDTYQGNGVFGASWWHVERIFSFAKSGVVVISKSYSIGD